VVRPGDEESTKMNSDVRSVRQLVEDVDVSNRWMMEKRREEELMDRLNSANGLVANTRPSSVGSQSEGFERGTFWEYGRCGLGSDLIVRREDDEHRTSLRNLPTSWKEADELGDGDGDHLRSLNGNGTVNRQQRCNPEKDDRGNILFGDRIEGWPMDDGPELRWQEDRVNLGPGGRSDGDMIQKTTASR
jgi:hypothetical protein